ncbi:MAG: ATP-binding protein [Lentisphaeria bacterium]|nr:ATP-binding protein [Lentisphaeria bacterium]
MILEFRTENFKSFVNETVFSMIPAPKQKGLDYSLLKAAKNEKVLCSAVIYGPNAAGKTNIIGAMDTLQSIVARGHIRNSKNDISPDFAAASLELIPNQGLQTAKPVLFFIDFIEQNYRVQYRLKLDLGTFLDEEYPRKILEESLLINGKPVFSRGESLQIADSVKFGPFSWPMALELENLKKTASKSLNPQELFLTNGFKYIFSKDIADFIIDWFTVKLMVIYRADSMYLIRRFPDPQKKTAYIDKTTNEAAKRFGISSNALGYILDGEDSKVKLFSIFGKNAKRKNNAVLANIFESYGTLRFINMFPLVIKAFQTGGTLIIDEFDASIHPMALMNIINIFHNDSLNTKRAQLIFNTHNPIFLNSNLFRRDEIKFVEHNEENHESVLYSLSDFGTSGENGVRRHEDYMKNYFVNRYGAIRDIDFTPVFEEIMSDAEADK